MNLGAVNSINWARVLAQITYYFWAYFRITDADPAIKTVRPLSSMLDHWQALSTL